MRSCLYKSRTVLVLQLWKGRPSGVLFLQKIESVTEYILSVSHAHTSFRTTLFSKHFIYFTEPTVFGLIFSLQRLQIKLCKSSFAGTDLRLRVVSV